ALDQENINGGEQKPPSRPRRVTLRPIYIGLPYAGGIIIQRVVVGDREFGRGDGQIPVKADSYVEIHGNYLSNYDSVALRIGSEVYTPRNISILPSQIHFNIPDYDETLLSGGG